VPGNSGEYGNDSSGRPAIYSPWRVRILHLAPQAGDQSGIASYAVRFRRAVEQQGLEIAALDVPNSIGDVRCYIAAALRAAPRADVVHAELGGGSLRELYAAAAVGHRRLAPVVLTLHDPPRLAWRPFHTAAVRERAALRALAALAGGAPARAAERVVARRAAAILTLSGLGAQRIAAAIGGPALVEQLPYPCEPAAPAPGPAAADRDPATDPGLVVGFHGYWYRGKGIETLLEAIAAIEAMRADAAPVRLRLWGAPPADGGERAGARYRAEILAAVQRLGIADLVEVLGRIPQEDVAARLRACDVVAVPYEDRWTVAGLASISSVVYDALAAGTPVVATDVRAIGETVRDGVDGLLVAPGDASSLAAALCRLRDDPALRRRLRDGAATLATELGLEATGRSAARVYRAIVPNST
jgi:glycosyltransferase involved in cell wall biosynthesis